MIEQTTVFLSTVFLCSEFKLENIYFGVNVCGKNVCGSLENRKNYNQQKFCATRYVADSLNPRYRQYMEFF